MLLRPGAGSGIAGILRYEYSTNGVNWQTENTINGLNHNTEYTIQIKAIDKAGNESTGSITGKTAEVPGGNAIGFNASATTWTKGPIAVEITWPQNIQEYTKQYKINNGEWTIYSETIPMSSNGTIYARLLDSRGQAGTSAEYAISWIDNVAPSAPTLRVSSGTAGTSGWYRSNVTVTITNGTDSLGEIQRTAYSISGSQNTSETTGNSVSITSEGTSTITAYTYDKAGNKSAAGSITVKKDSVGPVFSGLTSKTVTSYSSSTFTSGVSATDATSGMNGTFSYSPSTLSNGSNTITYTAKDNAGNTTTATRSITLNSTAYLVDKVSLGDYVAYDAGTWSSTVSTPTSSGNIGGYTAGTNKGTSVYTYGSYKATTNGWRVLSKTGSGSTGIVTLISAGCPASGYYTGGSKSRQQTMLSNMQSFITSNFVNSSYATSGRVVLQSDGDAMTSAGVKDINSYYWYGEGWGSNMVAGGITYIIPYYSMGGGIGGGTQSNVAHGIRPIITLKAGVLTNGSKDTSFLGQTCWAVK